MNHSKMQEKAELLFSRYERAYNHALCHPDDVDSFSAFYTDEMIAASPAGVKTVENDKVMKDALKQGFQFNRASGTKNMKCVKVNLTPLGTHHGVAHTSWRAYYHQSGKEIEIPFDNHYLIQFIDDDPLIFGWVTGDEMKALKDYGVIDE